MGISQDEAKKSGEEAAVEKEEKYLAEEAVGGCEESDDGASAVNVEYGLDAETAEATGATDATEDGSF